MLKVGLTGNIGSGKTLVAEIFSRLEIPVFHADLEAKKQFGKPDIREKILDLFGSRAFAPDGNISPNYLSSIVFSDPVSLHKLNMVIHPAVRQDYRQWCEKQIRAPYTLYEAAILFESGHYREMDKVICVTAPEELRIQRVMERDHVSRAEVEKRIASQWPDEKKAGLADFIIKNDGNEMLIPQILRIHNQLTTLSNQQH